MTTKTKATPGILNYELDYGPWLAGEDGLGVDTIATSTWEVPTGIVKDSDINTTTTTTITLSGGTARVTYDLINTITTASGLSDRRCLSVEVSECR